jgi:nicotinamide phosphoribosyltransferase
MNTNNLITDTDSYKLGHWAQLPANTEKVYSYLESRPGAAHPYTVFFGLQYLLKKYFEPTITQEMLDEALLVLKNHFTDPDLFNREGWQYIIDQLGGKLPLRIKAVPEGTVIPTGNVLMTVENTDPHCYWLTNYVEGLLLHVWYPTTVATRSRATKEMLEEYLEDTADGNLDGINFMLHDFGYRGVSSHESAGIGGAAHLVNFQGTDTIPALLFAKNYYNANLETLGFSVPATEHSVMTAQGEEGEHSVIQRLLDTYPESVLSVVNDSYDYQRHVDWLCTDFHNQIMDREGVFVTRPDSVPSGMTPGRVVLDILDRLWHSFGGHPNVQGFKVLDPHVRVLWGDGIEAEGIEAILKEMAFNSYSAENIVFGMGGGLLQKVNRDTENFSIKSSAQQRDGQWHQISKNAPGKVSKAGRLMLVRGANGTPTTVPLDSAPAQDNLLETVFENGRIVKEYTFDEVRANAKL